MSRRRPALTAALAALALAACPERGAERPRVVVYCALDRLYAQPLLEAWQARSGVEVLPKWDSEATKTTGLVEALRAEAAQPRCDVFWNNEVSQTVALAREGLLAAYLSPSAADLPAAARDPRGLWAGFAARARVLLLNTDRVAPEAAPRSVDDLLDPRWRGQVGLAKPLFGTTATHVAALWARDPQATRRWLAGLKANQVVICAGNADVKDRVAQGELAFGLTDSDDANLALQAGAPVRVVFPDQEGPGTLLIPNSVAILAGAPHPEQARALVDFLLSPEVEAALARARSAQVPLRAGIERPAWIPAELRVIPVAWEQAGEAVAAAREAVQRELLGP